MAHWWLVLIPSACALFRLSDKTSYFASVHLFAFDIALVIPHWTAATDLDITLKNLNLEYWHSYRGAEISQQPQRLLQLECASRQTFIKKGQPVYG